MEHISKGIELFEKFLDDKGNAYRAMQEFHKIAQGPSDHKDKKVVLDFLNSELAMLFRDYAFWQENCDKDRVSSEVIKSYLNDETLSGYGDKNYDKGGDTIHEQQRGLLLPALEEFLEGSKPVRVVEVGTGNGDMVAYLAGKFPQHEFVGVDFSTTSAEKNHAGTNLKFVKGYALDLIESGQVKGDVVFASSTFMLFTPLELQAYIRAFRKNGFKTVVLNDPTWAGHEQKKDDTVVSFHLEGSCWFHNFSGYLLQEGYEMTHFSNFHYKHKKSERPDIYVLVAIAQLVEK